MQKALANLKGRDIFLLSLVGVLLVGLLWYFLLYSSRRAEIDTANAQLTTLQTQVEAARQASAQLPGLRENVARLAVQRDELLRALPATARFGAVLAEIRGNILASGADLTRISRVGDASGVTAPPGVQPINLSIAVDGTFNEVYAVLRSLEDMNRFSTINSLGLSLGTATSFDPTLSGTMGVTVYTFDPNAAAAGAPQGATPAGAAPAAPQGAPVAPPAGGSQ